MSLDKYLAIGTLIAANSACTPSEVFTMPPVMTVPIAEGGMANANVVELKNSGFSPPDKRKKDLVDTDDLDFHQLQTCTEKINTTGMVCDDKVFACQQSVFDQIIATNIGTNNNCATAAQTGDPHDRFPCLWEVSDIRSPDQIPEKCGLQLEEAILCFRDSLKSQGLQCSFSDTMKMAEPW